MYFDNFCIGLSRKLNAHEHASNRANTYSHANGRAHLGIERQEPVQCLSGLDVFGGFRDLIDEFTDLLRPSAESGRVLRHAHGQAFLQAAVLTSIPRQNRDLAIPVVKTSEQGEWNVRILRIDRKSTAKESAFASFINNPRGGVASLGWDPCFGYLA